MANLKKPIKGKRYVNHKAPEVKEPNFTEAEVDLAARAASNPSSLDLSVKEDADLSDAEVLTRYRQSLTNTVLPTAPNIPGFHACWVPLTSNNQSDTPDYRKKLGYEFVREEEVPGFISPSNRSATMEGCVVHNELILMKLPLRLYQIYMKEAHHTKPIEYERSIKDSIDSKMVDEEGQSIKRDEAEMTGMRKLARKTPEPTFAS